MSDLELTDYANRYLKDSFANVDGVGQINLGGERELSLRIWLDPTAMAARNITVQELEDSLRKQNVEFPAGKVESKKMDLIIKVEKAYVTIEDYKDLILKRNNDGSLVKLRDVARLELGALNTSTLFKGNGVQNVGIGIYQQSTANTIEVAKLIKEKKSAPDGQKAAPKCQRPTLLHQLHSTIHKAVVDLLVHRLVHQLGA